MVDHVIESSDDPREIFLAKSTKLAMDVREKTIAYYAAAHANSDRKRKLLVEAREAELKLDKHFAAYETPPLF